MSQSLTFSFQFLVSPNERSLRREEQNICHWKKLPTQEYTGKETRVRLSKDHREGEVYSCRQDNLIPGWEYWGKLKLMELSERFPRMEVYVSVPPNLEVVYFKPLFIKSGIVHHTLESNILTHPEYICL